MKNTIPAPSKSSDMVMNYERETWVNTPGSLNTLLDMLSKHGVSITMQELMRIMPLYLLNMTEKQKTVFRSYYWKKMSIHEIRVSFGYKAISDVERPLIGATNKFIKLLLDDKKHK